VAGGGEEFGAVGGTPVGEEVLDLDAMSGVEGDGRCHAQRDHDQASRTTAVPSGQGDRDHVEQQHRIFVALPKIAVSDDSDEQRTADGDRGANPDPWFTHQLTNYNRLALISIGSLSGIA
jgi:hypothetical protein